MTPSDHTSLLYLVRVGVGVRVRARARARTRVRVRVRVRVPAEAVLEALQREPHHGLGQQRLLLLEQLATAPAQGWS